MDDEQERYPQYSGTASKVMGAIQIICSIIITGASIAGIVAIAPNPETLFTGLFITGLIFGILKSQTRIPNSEIGSLITYLTIQNHFISFCIAGAFGIIAGKTKKKNHVVVNMVLSVLSCIAGFAIALACAYFIFLLSVFCLLGSSSCSLRLGLLSLILIVPLLEAAVALGSSIICCRVTCCGVSSQPGTVIAMPVHGQGTSVQPAYVQYGGQPQVAYPNQPGMMPPSYDGEAGYSPQKFG